MTTERFIIFLLGCALAYFYFFGTPEIEQPQRSSQPITIDTSAPATVVYIEPVFPTIAFATAAPYPTATAVPTLPGPTLASDGTPEPQRAEQGNERGCASTRSCDD
jgi:hypothetical protein